MADPELPANFSDADRTIKYCLGRLKQCLQREAVLERRVGKLNLFESHEYEYRDNSAVGSGEQRMIKAKRDMAKRRDKDDPMVQIMIERRDQYQEAKANARRCMEEADTASAVKYDMLAAVHLKGMQEAEHSLKTHASKHYDRVNKMVSDFSRIASEMAKHRDRIELEREDLPEMLTDAEVEAEIQALRKESGEH